MNTPRCPKTTVSAALAALASGAFFWGAPRAPVWTAQARPIYAQETGLPCGRCHVNPSGGGRRTAFGRAFAANGHRLPGERHYRRDDYDAWGNRCPDGMMGGCGSHGMMGGYGHGPGMMNW